jgi:hypothetical protein
MPYGWEAPGGTHSVAFALPVISALRARVLEASHALPRRGAEIGGFLLGRVLGTHAAEHSRLRVTAFEELPIEYCYGPSYRLSEADEERLREALSRRRTDPVIGFIRSYTGPHQGIPAEDAALFRSYFPDARCVFLMLKPEGSASCPARLLFWEGDEFPAEPRYPPFEFDPRKMQIADTPVEVPLVETVPEPAPAEAAASTEVVVEAAPEHLEASPPQARSRRFWLPLLQLLLVSIAAAGVYELWNLAREPRWAPLRLDARKADGAIRLSWDPSTRPARDASRGLLIITDGGQRQTAVLTRSQIRGGQYTYIPRQSDVLFRLELQDNALFAAGDSLRVVTVTAPGPSSAAPEPAPTADRPAALPDKPERAAVPPEPLREIQPEIPPGIRARIQYRTVVPVDVRVSPAGGVLSAAARGQGDGLYQYLAARAAAAARSWRFSPAKSAQDRPVAGSRTLYFVFEHEERE